MLELQALDLCILTLIQEITFQIAVYLLRYFNGKLGKQILRSLST